MAFLRKASMKLKPNADGEGTSTPRNVSNSSIKDPKQRVLSESNGADGGHKRKGSFKGRKRLSSLFSSSSLSSHLSDKEREGSAEPSSRPSSNLNISTTSSSTASTPTGHATPPKESGSSRKYPGLGLGSQEKDVDGVTDGIGRMGVSSPKSPLVESPTSSSPPTAVLAGDPARTATEQQLYGQWVASDDEDTSDEELSFRTPSEGLSEVEEEAGEEDEEEAEVVHRQQPVQIQPQEVKQGTIADGQDVLGTGPSTIKRSKPARKTQVVRNLHASKEKALSIDQEQLLAPDLDACREILTLFLTSRMREAEEQCREKDPDGNRLYMLSAGGIIQALKGMMTFDSVDLGNALEITRGTAVVATALRKPSDSIVTRLGGLVKTGAGVARVKAMTHLERHAELVYAETSLMKALLAIIAGGDWLGLVKEALNMRTAHGIYRTLQQYIEEADKGGFDENIDMDFRSGVLLGTGTSSLMLSLLPGKVLKIAEVFGYAGDRKVALETLMAAGGWHHGADKPDFDEKNEGLRRPICDMILLTFHLVISVLMPVAGVDIPVARAILGYNMRRYPDGIFFLYFQARLHTSQCEPELANKSLQRALDLDLEYVQLQHMCLWDYACNFFMLGNWKGALDCFSILKDESNWSRAVYTYAAAASLVELIEDGHSGATKEKALELMDEIPKLTKKIAGKSLPIEKLCSRKARKFHSQNHRLFLPAMELAYVFGSLSHTPRRSLLQTLLPRIDKMLAKLEGVEPAQYGNGHEYWDDYTLGHFLRGVVQFTARYQPPEAADSAKISSPGEPTDEEIDAGAEKDFNLVLEHAPKVELDHYIIYHCHFELGKLYAARGDDANARKNFDIVMSGKAAEGKQYQKSQGKYSLEGALMLKTHAAQQALREREKGLVQQAQ